MLDGFLNRYAMSTLNFVVQKSHFHEGLTQRFVTFEFIGLYNFEFITDLYSVGYDLWQVDVHSKI